MASIDACLELLRQEFEKENIKGQVKEFLKRASYSSKWMLYSDYCLDDQNKPNDVLSFVLIPFISEKQYQELEKRISETQAVDIKHAKSISSEFIYYIKEQAIFSFSFIVNDRQKLFGCDNEEQIKTVVQFLTRLKENFTQWRENTDNQELQKYYNDCINKLKRQLGEIFLKKKAKNQIDVLLITLLASYYTASILKQLPDIQIFGWFPDRDKTNETCEGLAVPIFHALQYEFLEAKQYEFYAAKPDSSVVPFYDNENRIADIICGTLADCNIKDNLISKDKFDKVLTGLIADNMFIKVYKFFVETNRTHLEVIEIKKKEL